MNGHRLACHAPDRLPAAARDAMWALVAPAVRSTRQDFEQGLLRMDEVWLLEIRGEVKGFGGVRFFYPEWQGRRACVIFTGRVYLDPSVRGGNLLQRIGLRYYLRCLRASPLQRIYWMFGAGSYKSYLLLPRNFRHYWPHPQQGVPVRERALLDQVALELDNPHYDPATAIMSHPELVYLDGGLGADPADLDDADIAFYARLNPGQIKGDDVMCLCPLTPANWGAALRNGLARMLRRRPAPAARPVAS